MSTLLQKYNVAGSRYTSYPTVPFWDKGLIDEKDSQERWKQSLKDAFWVSGKELSLYIHLPFCETMCTYCGCTTRITKNHDVEKPYIDLIEKEWKLYLDTFPQKPVLRELHLGGGTPTFFSPKNLKRLLSIFLNTCEVAEEVDFGFEGHPNNTTFEHLKTLKTLGFNRVSFGIQDFDEQVQQSINRIQPYEKVVACVDNARKLGFEAINFDLVYGLPFQNHDTIRDTLEKVTQLAPSRIAFYGYAHIPWLKPAQRKLEKDLPTPAEKAGLYKLGKKLLTDNGYIDIGMDHFALPSDALIKAVEEGELHRNFMGYTTQQTSLSVGLGVSAISDTWTAFSQNEKDFGTYREKINKGEFPTLKGHFLTKKDETIRKHILNLMCTYKTSWFEQEFIDYGLSFNFSLLEQLKNDGLVVWNENHLKITEKGKPFVRNVCMAFDEKLWNTKLTQQVFSKTV